MHVMGNNSPSLATTLYLARNCVEQSANENSYQRLFPAARGSCISAGDLFSSAPPRRTGRGAVFPASGFPMISRHKAFTRN